MNIWLLSIDCTGRYINLDIYIFLFLLTRSFSAFLLDANRRNVNANTKWIHSHFMWKKFSFHLCSSNTLHSVKINLIVKMLWSNTYCDHHASPLAQYWHGNRAGGCGGLVSHHHNKLSHSLIGQLTGSIMWPCHALPGEEKSHDLHNCVIYSIAFRILLLDFQL